MNEMLSVEEAENLAEWFRKNKRTLPWRDTGDPYKVWISEIMLQQTRIEAVRDRFIQFTKELPDIRSLAEAEDDRLMKLWEGMGYYSRARNLKKCACVLKNEYHCSLPADYKELKSLPGIGPYTAGAIASIAYGIAVPAVDGNVMRVLARRCMITEDIRQERTKQTISAMIQNLFAENSEPSFVSSFNQGIMELGETICVPNGTPHCDVCPLSAHCLARLQNAADRIPFRSSLKERRIQERTLLILRDGDRFYLRKRPQTGLLAGLYEFPGIEQKLTEKEAVAAAETMGILPLQIRRLPDAKHIFSHLEWHMTAYEIRCEQIESLQDPAAVTVNKKELAQLAVPSAFRTYTDYYALKD